MNVCDHDHETADEVKLLPLGGGANIIVCYHHYTVEISSRLFKLAKWGVDVSLPEWDNLKRYSDVA